MKRFVLFFFLITFFTRVNSAPIAWTGLAGDGLWSTPANWAPTTVPGANDDVIFAISATVEMDILSLGTYAVINSLQVTGIGTSIELRRTQSGGGTKILQVKSTNATTMGLEIDAGCTLLIHGINTDAFSSLSYILDLGGTTGVTGEIFGELQFSGVGSAGTSDDIRLRVYTDAMNYASLVVRSGGIIRYLDLSGSTTSAVGTYLTMENGSTYEIAKEGGLFPEATWQPNSLARAVSPGAAVPGFIDGMIYGNLEWDCQFQIDNDLSANVTFNNVHLISTNGFYFRITGIASGSHTMTINGNLDIDAGSFIDIVGALALAGSSGKIILKGHLNNQGLLNTNGVAGTTSQFELQGSANQNITNGGILSGVRLEFIMNGNSATLLTLLILPGNNNATGANLQLVNGKIFTTAVNLLRLNDDATASGGSPASFVSGPMRKVGNDNFVFPVGIGGIYAPISITNVAGQTAAEQFTAEYKRANPQSTTPYGPGVVAGMDHVSYVEYWTLTRLGGSPAVTKRVSLAVTPLSFCKVLASTYVSKWSSASMRWTYEGLSSPVYGPPSGLYETGTISSTNAISNFSIPNNAFTLITDLDGLLNPLPISLISFDAIKLTNTKASLNWELAACCSAAARFVVERADGNRSFSKIAAVNGSETNRFYTYTDNGLKSGINYYRLKMIDEDGKITYSRTVAIMNGVDGLLLTSLIPTIITNTATLTIASSNRQQLDLVIVDMQGRVMQKQNHTVAAGNTTIQLSTDRLPAGMYQLVGITAEGKTNMIRFIKQ